MNNSKGSLIYKYILWWKNSLSETGGWTWGSGRRSSGLWSTLPQQSKNSWPAMFMVVCEQKSTLHMPTPWAHRAAQPGTQLLPWILVKTVVTPSAANPVWADDKIIVPTVTLAAVDPPPPPPIYHHCLHPEFCVSLWPYHSIHTPFPGISVCSTWMDLTGSGHLHLGKSRHGMQYLNGPDWIRTPSLAYVTTRHAVPEWTPGSRHLLLPKSRHACNNWYPTDYTGSGHLHLRMSGRLTCHDTSRHFTLGTKLDTDIVEQSGHITHNRLSVDGVSWFSKDGGSMRQLHPDNVPWDRGGGGGEGGGGRRSGRAADSWPKGPGFKSPQELWENFLLQGQLSVLTLISVPVLPL